MTGRTNIVLLLSRSNTSKARLRHPQGRNLPLQIRPHRLVRGQPDRDGECFGRLASPIHPRQQMAAICSTGSA
jgi:threonine dehydrogenase-like Zn-dependent dehydrogenase